MNCSCPKACRSTKYGTIDQGVAQRVLGDGQMFFYYKRNGVASIPYTKVAGDDKLYVLPLPQQEVDFGGREDLIGRER